MPSVTLDLGRYVQLRGPRADGTFRVLFIVPGRLRPSGWSAAIPLPITGDRKGDLRDLDEVARIRADAKALHDQLLGARRGAVVAQPAARDLPTLNRLWQLTGGFKGTKPRTQRGYAYHAGLIEAWSASVGHKPVASLRRERIEEFLALYDDRPTTRRHLKIVFRMLLGYAVDLGWRADNPAARIKAAAPKTTVTIWERVDVERETWACVMAGFTPIAAMILTQWEIGQRMTDARLFRRGAEYQPPADGRMHGAFRFWQEKTQSYVTIPISQRLEGMLEAIYDPDSLYLFVDRATGAPFDEQRLGHVFQKIRSGQRGLQLRALRHSCVVQLARAGCTTAEIAAITGHSLRAVELILARYLPRDNEVAWNAQQKRGLISTSREQESNGRPAEKSNGRVA
jgi:hypothetical protein